jgi:hypothetical protein
MQRAGKMETFAILFDDLTLQKSFNYTISVFFIQEMEYVQQRTTG